MAGPTELGLGETLPQEPPHLRLRHRCTMGRKTALTSILALLLTVTACSGANTPAASDSGQPSTGGNAATTLPNTTGNPASSDDTTLTDDRAMTACTEIGCLSAITIELGAVDIQPGAAYDLEFCVDGDCRYETVVAGSGNLGETEVEAENGGTGETTRAKPHVDPETDTVTYQLPEGEYPETIHVYFAVADAGGETLAQAENVEVHLDKNQPNGPDCPPVCFHGHLKV